MTCAPLPFEWNGISADELRRELSYCPETGVFRWLKKKARVQVGDVAGTAAVGTRSKQPYLYIKIGQRRYAAHRLAWLWMTGEWPALQIDHANGVALDNRWGNLRLATASQNQANCRRPINNSTGFKGVTFVRRNGKYRAQISAGRVTTWLGEFDTPQEAHEAYVAAAVERHGQFARAS